MLDPPHPVTLAVRFEAPRLTDTAELQAFMYSYSDIATHIGGPEQLRLT